MGITIEDLITNIKNYADFDLGIIEKAYEYAKDLHFGQKRESGEDYIIHPLNVAYILSEMHADIDTICAALLHDTIEDTKATKADIEAEFNLSIASLVCGVTKISKLIFSSKQEESIANKRKIIVSLIEDARIIIIKLADRLHNMRTLQFISEPKQKENAKETMELFVPLAYYIGAYRIKSELEDLSLQYSDPIMYQNIATIKRKLEADSQDCLYKMFKCIESILEDNNIPNEIKIRTKNIFGIYKRITENKGQKIAEIHDLLALKIMVDNIKNCYLTLGLVHQLYRPINDKFKDYICNPKTNMYQSLHTTVFAVGERLVQTQIRTFDMDKVASFGLTTYWDINKVAARKVMQDNLRERFQFYKSLTEIDAMFSDNQEFLSQVSKELFSGRIYVYTTEGIPIELPIGSTPIDFAYGISKSIGDTMVAAIVNGEYVSLDYKLQNKDRVKIITDDLSFGSRNNWSNMTQTIYAKKMIDEFPRQFIIN